MVSYTTTPGKRFSATRVKRQIEKWMVLEVQRLSWVNAGRPGSDHRPFKSDRL